MRAWIAPGRWPIAAGFALDLALLAQNFPQIQHPDHAAGVSLGCILRRAAALNWLPSAGTPRDVALKTRLKQLLGWND
jgi:hypothetical protein